MQIKMDQAELWTRLRNRERSSESAEYAREWADLMEVEIARGYELTTEIAERTYQSIQEKIAELSRVVKLEEIIPEIDNGALAVLYQVWRYGKELRQIWRKHPHAETFNLEDWFRADDILRATRLSEEVVRLGKYTVSYFIGLYGYVKQATPVGPLGINRVIVLTDRQTLALLDFTGNLEVDDHVRIISVCHVAAVSGKPEYVTETVAVKLDN